MVDQRNPELRAGFVIVANEVTVRLGSSVPSLALDIIIAGATV